MRMWKIDPSLLCNKHLLGEHVEMHMFEGAIRLGKSIAGYVEKGLVETDQIVVRHDALAVEMARRGIKHHSPINAVKIEKMGTVDAVQNAIALSQRCQRCKERMEVKVEK